jgi:hypothetical protein
MEARKYRVSRNWNGVITALFDREAAGDAGIITYEDDEFIILNKEQLQNLKHQAIRRGFEAALALDEDFQVRFPEFADFEKHLADEAEYAATLARIAQAEEGESHE